MDIKRRHRADQWEPSEKLIQDAIWEVEKIGADEKLTEAVILMAKAKELVSDFIDSKSSTLGDPPPPPPIPPGPRDK